MAITDDNEKEHLKSLELQTSEVKYRNKKAKREKFYGERLRLIIHLYRRKIEWVAFSCNTNIAYVSNWMNNIKTPNREELRQLAMLFEVSEDFFTKRNITINIEEQKVLTVIENKDKDDIFYNQES